MKLYSPGKKGATIEIRKSTGFEIVHVEFVRKFICAILDAFIAGEVLTDITKRFKGNTKKSVNANKSSMYECNYCNFETKFAKIGLMVTRSRGI